MKLYTFQIRDTKTGENSGQMSFLAASLQEAQDRADKCFDPAEFLVEAGKEDAETDYGDAS